MAQHLEIGKAGFDIVFKENNPEPFRDNPTFKRVPFKGGKIYLNSRDYNEGTGLRGDEYVLTFEPKKGDECYEIHFNYRNQINKVYLVA